VLVRGSVKTEWVEFDDWCPGYSLKACRRPAFHTPTIFLPSVIVDVSD